MLMYPRAPVQPRCGSVRTDRGRCARPDHPLDHPDRAGRTAASTDSRIESHPVLQCQARGDGQPVVGIATADREKEAADRPAGDGRNAMLADRNFIPTPVHITDIRQPMIRRTFLESLLGFSRGHGNHHLAHRHRTTGMLCSKMHRKRRTTKQPTNMGRGDSHNNDATSNLHEPERNGAAGCANP